MNNNKGYAIYNKEKDLYETTLPGVTITPRNLDLAQVVRNGTSKVARPLLKTAGTIVDFTPLSSALATGKAIGAIEKYQTSKDKEELKGDLFDSLLGALSYEYIKNFTKPIKFPDKIVKTITSDKFGIDKITLSTPRKGVIADIELSPAANEFGKKWLHPEFIHVAEKERGKGLSNVLYDEGIKHAKSKGYNGILSGEVLLQPSKTIKTQKRFNGPEERHFIEEYNYPIKGMESPKDPKLSKKIVKAYNKANEVSYDVVNVLLKQLFPGVALN